MTNFGDLFELFVGELLQRYFGKTAVENLNESGLKVKICDYLVKTEQCDILIECKSSLLPLVTRQTYSENMLQDWFDKNIIKAIIQLRETEIKIQSRDGVGECVKIVLIYEDFNVAEEPSFKEYAKQVVKEETGEDVSFFIMTLSELEQLEDTFRKAGFKALVEKKMEIDDESDVTKGFSFLYASQQLGSFVRENEWYKSKANWYFNEYVKKLKANS